MRSEDIFALGLGLTPPWEVSKVEFVQEPDKSKTLHIYIDFRKGGEFVYDAGQKQKTYGKEDKMWRHLNFFQQVLSPLPCAAHYNVQWQIQNGRSSVGPPQERIHTAF